MAIPAFYVATLVFFWVTWRYAVVSARGQGPYRFVGFEGIVALVLLDWRLWFVAVSSPWQIASFVVLALAVALAPAGFLALKRHGKPQGHFEYTTELVTRGVFRFIRHPMYASLTLLALGAYLKQPLSAAAAAIFVVTAVAFFLCAKAEEKDLIAAFGERYRDYMRRTARFIPFLL